ncbi:MAG: SIMPL domain-containing protein [Minisyncoccota bacterium]
MHDSILKTVKVSSFALIAISTVIYSYQFAQSVRQAYPGKTFSVEGEGEIELIPDVAQFSVGVVTEGSKDIVEVQRINTERMNTINAFLTEHGVEKKDLKTKQYELAPKYDYSPCVSGTCPASVISGYTLSQTLDVKVRDIKKLGTLLSGVVEKGANNVSNVSFVIDDIEGAQAEARLKAMTQAKQKAKVLAQAGGFHLGSLVSISEAGPPLLYGREDIGGVAMNTFKAEAPRPEPGTDTTKVHVTLTYEIVGR